MRNSLIFYPLIKSKVEIFAFNLKIFHSHLCADFMIRYTITKHYEIYLKHQIQNGEGI
jgi:hypothetical protein